MGFQNSTDFNPIEIILDESIKLVTITFGNDMGAISLDTFTATLESVSKRNPKKVVFDLTNTYKISDNFLVLLAFYIERFRRAGYEVELQSSNQQIEESIKNINQLLEQTKREETSNNPPLLLEQIGELTFSSISSFKRALEFVGEVLLTFFRLPFTRSRAHKGHLVRSLYHVGIGGIPIVTLISMLLGLVVAFMTSIQLEQFGAQIYVASLLTIAMTKELGPLITGIIVAGRSGSSFASEIGAMKIAEELDALSSMGLNVHRFLLVPKMLSTAISLPILSLFSQFFGILGGFIVGIFIIGLSPHAYLEQTINSLNLFDMWWGTMKCVVFGLLISGIGCYEGLRVEKGATSVGKAATSAVVKGIFFIILFDSIFAIILVYW